VDRIYLSITAWYMFSVLLSCLFANLSLTRVLAPRFERGHVKDSHPLPWIVYVLGCFGLGRVLSRIAMPGKESVAAIAMLQYPVHLYSMIALRTSNAPLLHGDSENAWGFGQIVAVVTMFATLFECGRGIHSEFFFVVITIS
jgi:hypothetical protein